MFVTIVRKPNSLFARQTDVVVILYRVLFQEGFNVPCFCAFVYMLILINLDIGTCCCYGAVV